ncbi:hypothetical protein DRJ04_05605 [Candidatus Aerophobetes bacterium]|uniref:Mth938-like domain-containing protein n=1 Tax=Aerophobetes bacterium TaxID=2030807 RepID=A0A662DDZ5_UNCAE|nr:MAG: hypothetical protein DRJ04_05605 [Candidatus Aerophobetes bacterium]
MIERYTFGQITIRGKTYTSDVIIHPDERVDDNWWRKEGHLLLPEDLEEVVKEKPDILIVGTGNSGLMEVPASTKKWIESKGIKLIACPTKEACNIYNQLYKSGSRVTAAFHLTC